MKNFTKEIQKMSLNKELLNRITEECKVLEDNDTEFAVKKIEELDERFERDNLVEIYNYLLSVAINPKILISLIHYLMP